MLQQGMTKFGLNSSNETENFLTGNHESDITVKNNITIIEDESTKSDMIKLLKDFLLKNHQITQEQSKYFEASLRKKSANQPICIAFVEEERVLSRNKRISLQDQENFIANHIKDHCAFEPEMLQLEIVDEGELLLIKAQRAENPFRMIYDDIPRHQELPVDNFARKTASGLNWFVNIITFGIKEVISSLIANHYRKQYYELKNDTICSTRQNHLNLAVIATSLDVSDLTFTTRGKMPKIMKNPLNVDNLPFTTSGDPRVNMPQEIINAKPLPNRATYISRNKNTNVYQEIIFKFKNDNKVSKVIVDNGREILLKKTENGEFVTYHPHATRPEHLERRVIINEKTKTWRYADSFSSERLDVEVMDGKKFIKLHGNNYELQMNHNQHYEIVAEHTSGIKKYIPVYMEPLSKLWHLKTHNEKPVFSNQQEHIIERLKVIPEKDKSYLANDLSCGIFEIRDTNKDSFTNHALYSVVEINGKLVPVKVTISPGQGVQYNLYNLKNAHGKIHPIEWEGNRWIFDRATSPHVSKELRKTVKYDVHEKIDASKLSTPDHYGVRWDKDNNSYIKINNNFFKIKKQSDSINRFYIKINKENHVLRFKNGKFHSETITERIKNIQEVGLNGRKRKSAEDILAEQGGFNKKRARELLEEYDFPESGFFDSVSFAFSIEQIGSIPKWSERFKKDQRNVRSRKLDYSEQDITSKLGEEISSGIDGKVFLDKDDSNYVIKKMENQHDEDYPIDIGLKMNEESEMFRKCYGEESSKVYTDANGNYYNRMFRIPGKPLHSLPEKSLPDDAMERYVDMLEKLNHLDIIHGDLHPGNVMWDQETKMFYPIDISNIKESFLKGNANDKTVNNYVGNIKGISMIDGIIKKLKRPLVPYKD